MRRSACFETSISGARVEIAYEFSMFRQGDAGPLTTTSRPRIRSFARHTAAKPPHMEPVAIP